jgi:mevalonate pyrophosphate decarboxylase
LLDIVARVRTCRFYQGNFDIEFWVEGRIARQGYPAAAGASESSAAGAAAAIAGGSCGSDTPTIRAYPTRLG